MEGATELYISKLSRLFFVCLRDAASEFAFTFSEPERKSGQDMLHRHNIAVLMH